MTDPMGPNRRHRLDLLLKTNFPEPAERQHARLAMALFEDMWAQRYGGGLPPLSVLADIFDAACGALPEDLLEAFEREIAMALIDPELVRVQAEAVRGRLFEPIREDCGCYARPPHTEQPRAPRGGNVAAAALTIAFFIVKRLI